MISIKHTFHIDASKMAVFKAISKIDHLKNWWTYDINGNEELGGTLKFKFGNNGFIQFKVVEIKESLFYKWHCIDAHPEWIGTDATFCLTDNDGKTKVEFVHSGWKEQSEFYASCNFSWGRYFISLRNYLESGKGDPYRD